MVQLACKTRSNQLNKLVNAHIGFTLNDYGWWRTQGRACRQLGFSRQAEETGMLAVEQDFARDVQLCVLLAVYACA